MLNEINIQLKFIWSEYGNEMCFVEKLKRNYVTDYVLDKIVTYVVLK